MSTARQFATSTWYISKQLTVLLVLRMMCTGARVMHYTKADELQQSKHFLYETVFLDTYKVILLLHSGTYEKRWGVCTVAQQPAETHSLFKKTFLVLVDKCASVGTSHRKESQTRFTKTLVMHWLIVMGWKMETCLCLLSILYSVHPLSMWV